MASSSSADGFGLKTGRLSESYVAGTSAAYRLSSNFGQSGPNLNDSIAVMEQQQHQNGTAAPMDGGSTVKVEIQDLGTKQLANYVGFSNLPNQIHRKSMKRGFHFVMMVVGESGLGKSTLINSLFNSTLFPPRKEMPLSENIPTRIDIKAMTGEIIEAGVSLKLTVIDVPGFGDFINNENCYQAVLENLEGRFEAYYEQENRVNRKKIIDGRVHALLYLIAPTGHSLKPLDIEFMKKVCHRVNLIPVIAKADSLTPEEMEGFKKRILEELDFHKIVYYKPQTDDKDDSETVKECTELIKRMPFAVVASDDETVINGRKVRARKYPWGIIEVENSDLHDFVRLRQMLIRSNMEDLKEHTANLIYENYRRERLTSQLGEKQTSGILTRYDEEKKAHEAKLAKMEAEMQTVFAQKVAEKEAKLKQSEEELMTKHREMKEYLEKQRVELEEKRKKLDGRPATPEKQSFLKSNKKFFK